LSGTGKSALAAVKQSGEKSNKNHMMGLKPNFIAAIMKEVIWADFTRLG